MVINTIGKRVRYKSEGLSGTVKDQVDITEEYETRDFFDLVQLIQWDDGRYGIRLCYYVRNHDSGEKDWIFANRPLSISPENLGKLLKKALEKGWFTVF